MVTQTTGGQPGIKLKRLTKAAPSPKDAVDTVRQYGTVYHPEAVTVLDQILGPLFGNATKVYDLALSWGTNQVMSNDRTEIQTATNTMAAYWGGRAADQYNTFESAAVGVMATNQQQIGYICNTLGDCVALVYDTYASALKFIGQCAHDLTSAATNPENALIPVPGVGEAVVVITWVNILNDFVNNYNQMMAEALSTMGSYAKEGTYFIGYASSYAAPAGGADALDQTDGWTVKPEDGSTGTTGTVPGRG